MTVTEPSFFAVATICSQDSGVCAVAVPEISNVKSSTAGELFALSVMNLSSIIRALLPTKLPYLSLRLGSGHALPKRGLGSSTRNSPQGGFARNFKRAIIDRKRKL